MANSSQSIALRGVRVNNLKNLDLDVPHGQSIAICGLSGSGKTSLALDTLYAEGQRRYIESFSAYTRQFLSVMEKPVAEKLDGIPPAIAVTRSRRAITNRATVGSTTETVDYLREMYAKIAQPVCSCNNKVVRSFLPKEIGEIVESLPKETRLQIGFSIHGPAETLSIAASVLLKSGLLRGGVLGEQVSLEELATGELSGSLQFPYASPVQKQLLRQWEPIQFPESIKEELLQSVEELPAVVAMGQLGFSSVVNSFVEVSEPEKKDQTPDPPKRRPRRRRAKKKSAKKTTKKVSKRPEIFDLDSSFGKLPLDVVVDRISGGPQSVNRAIEAAEQVEQFGGTVFLWIDQSQNASTEPLVHNSLPIYGRSDSFGGREGTRYFLPSELSCPECNKVYQPPTPSHFNYNSPVGACSCCEGFGSVSKLDIKKIVPDDSLTIEEGAIVPWTTPKYKARLRKFIRLAEELEVPVDVPFKDLTPSQLDRVWNGKKELKFGGMNGFFDWLQQRNYKMHYRIYLARWKSYFECPECNGDRLNEDALAYQVNGMSIAAFCRLRVEQAIEWVEGLELSETEQSAVRSVLPQVRRRLDYLSQVGLGYVTLNRTVRSLSGGERQRTQLTTALGSSLVNMLYVLDEPSVGLHPRDVDRLIGAIEKLKENGNTVVMVDHQPSILTSVDRIVEIGPKAGEEGGEVVFDGPLKKLQKSKQAQTAPFVQYLQGNSSSAPKKKSWKKADESQKVEQTPRNWIQVLGACENNLKTIDVEIPTGVMSVVTGVSGAGKSTLVKDVLLPALQKKIAGKSLDELPLSELKLPKDIGEVVWIDDAPIGKSSRSNPVTYIKAFDPIRKVLAETPDAVAGNFTPGSFSFNVDGGRCTQCKGEGSLTIDMQFMPDVFMQCPECKGTRFQSVVLDVMFRGKNVHEILQLTVREALSFFRSYTKIQAKLQPLIDVGLDYVRLGQGAPTLSAGESQRLKLASYLSEKRKVPTLFILDEPSTGLHPVDIQKLLACFQSLLEVGHSLLVVEHNLQMISAADWMIDIGPESADKGGTVVFTGPPSKAVSCKRSVTGQYLKSVLGKMP